MQGTKHAKLAYVISVSLDKLLSFVAWWWLLFFWILTTGILFCTLILRHEVTSVIRSTSLLMHPFSSRRCTHTFCFGEALLKEFARSRVLLCSVQTLNNVVSYLLFFSFFCLTENLFLQYHLQHFHYKI